MSEVIILGAGMHPFGRFPDKTLAEIGSDACLGALQDANVEWQEVQAAYCGHVYGPSTVGQSVLSELGHSGIPIWNIANSCASGSSAFVLAYQAVATGLYDIALALGFERMQRGYIDNLEPTSPERIMGLAPEPAMYAMMARRHMEEYGTTIEQLAKVSVKNHKNGVLNPMSQYKKEFTVEEVLDSKMVCPPITLYQCCPTGEGAAAVVVCNKRVAKKHIHGPFVSVAASILVSQTYVRAEPQDITKRTIRASRQAYEIAGIGPEDLDLVELHDAFTIGEISHYESLGLCQKGEGGRLISEGVTELGGRIPVNPSGGLLAKGHPMGATGIAQLAELVWQLRGLAGQRQIDNARIGLAHCLGGLGGGVCTVNILKKG